MSAAYAKSSITPDLQEENQHAATYLRPAGQPATDGRPFMAPATGSAQDIQERTIRMSTANNKGHPQVIGAEKFAELVAEKSGGKIEVKIFPGGVLGPDLQNFSAMQGGTLEMTVVNASLLAGNVKQFAIFDLPFLFQHPRGSLRGHGRPGRQEAARHAAREGSGGPRLLGAGLPRHQQPSSGRSRRSRTSKA